MQCGADTPRLPVTNWRILMAREKYAVGLDYGTESGRAVVIRVRDGKELGACIVPLYRRPVFWGVGVGIVFVILQWIFW